MKLAIFPGHVGKDSGAIDGTADDSLYTIEAVITTSVASKVALFLQLLGIDYKLQGGSFDLRIANTRDCDFGISLHADSLPQKPGKRGYHIMHYPGSVGGLHLAIALESAIEACPGAVKARGIHTRRGLRILKETAFPCVLIEMGFLSNVTDEALLLQDHFQYEMAFSIVQGVRAFTYSAQ